LRYFINAPKKNQGTPTLTSLCNVLYLVCYPQITQIFRQISLIMIQLRRLEG